MKTITTDIAIIGSGLTGLTLAYLLREQGHSVVLIEARDRIGGRIHTLEKAGMAPLEMGATWLGRKHTALWNLLQELGIGVFEQGYSERAIYEPMSISPAQLVALPPNEDPSYRIQGGSSALIQALANTLQTKQIFTSQQVKSIRETETGAEIETGSTLFKAKKVVSTLPPYLFARSIAIFPELPPQLLGIAHTTNTWMGESIKVALAYAEPFWRAEGRSGTIFSNVGPITEMYDHANYEDDTFALKGFFNGSYFSISREERLAMVLRQLEKYFGPVVNDYLAYEEAVWRNDPLTALPYQSHVLPHQHNGHPVYRKSYWDDKLFVAGTETAAEYPGYMEGAVRSAQFVYEQLNLG